MACASTVYGVRPARASCNLVVDLVPFFLLLYMILIVEVDYCTQAYFLLHLGMPGRDFGIFSFRLFRSF